MIILKYSVNFYCKKNVPENKSKHLHFLKVILTLNLVSFKYCYVLKAYKVTKK